MTIVARRSIRTLTDYCIPQALPFEENPRKARSRSAHRAHKLVALLFLQCLAPAERSVEQTPDQVPR